MNSEFSDQGWGKRRQREREQFIQSIQRWRVAGGQMRDINKFTRIESGGGERKKKESKYLQFSNPKTQIMRHQCLKEGLPRCPRPGIWHGGVGKARCG